MVIEAAAALASLAAAGLAALWMRERRHLRRNLLLLAHTERAKIEAVARADQAEHETSRLREMLDALPLAVWRRDAAGTLIDRNRADVAAFGEMPAHSFAKNGAAVDVIGQAYPDAINPHLAETHVVIDGKRRLLRPVEVASGDGEKVGYAIDGTEAESAQRELHRHIAAHASVLESLAAAVAIFGANKRLKFFNTAFVRLWDLDERWLASEPMIGEILEHLHSSRRIPEYPDFRAFKRERCDLFTSLIDPRQEVMHLPDGRTLQLTISPHPFGGLTYVYDDVSDRLALERSYNTLAQVQRATLDNLFEGIAVYGGDGRLKLYNPAFCALWGLSPADVAGEPHIGEISDKVHHLLDDGDWHRLREELIAQVTCQMFTSAPLYRRDGSVLQVSSVPLPDGEVLLTYLDVSDTARVERALRERNQALETAARLKMEFVANVSHEMRTPLNSIIGFTEILDKQYFGPLNSSQHEYSRLILDSAFQLLALINDMIDLATIEAGDLELDRGEVNVCDLLHSVAALMREQARSRALEIDVSCPAGMCLIEADERRLKQALFNLVSNAVRFTPPGGIILIRAQRSANQLLLSVCERTGGITPDRPTGVRDCARRRNLTTTGFGLSLVKSLVEMHGGSVEIDAEPDLGTSVTCRLPIGHPGHENVVAAIGDDRERADSSGQVAAA